MKKVLILANHDIVIYNFRKELVEKLISENHEVLVALPWGERVEDLVRMGCVYYQIKVNRRGMNPIKDFSLFLNYFRLIKRCKPDVILTYTIKPNIYGGLAARILKIRYIANITGMGSIFKKNNLIRKLVNYLLKKSLKDATVFFQNRENQKYFEDNNISCKKEILIPGSGVNIKNFQYLPYPNSDEICFIFVARIMKEKGIDEYLWAAKKVKEKGLKARFEIYGFFEEDQYRPVLEKYQEKKIIYYCGFEKNMNYVYNHSHCLVVPSYQEGMSNVILEAAACGRPAIVSNISGCKEIIDNHQTGILVEVKNKEDLFLKIEEFINYPQAVRIDMGKKARKKVKAEFDRNIIVNAYLEEIVQYDGAGRCESVNYCASNE